MANIKLGTDTLTGVAKVRLQNADVAGEFVVFNDLVAQEKSASPTTAAQEIVPDAGKYLSKVTVGGVPTETKSVDLALADGNQTVTPTSGKFLSSVTIKKPATLVPANIKKDVVIAGVTGTLEAGAGIPGGYNVTFSADGVAYSVVSIVAGNAISEPIPPSLSGQAVAGWSTDSAGENLVSFPYTPTANVTLYAKLSAVSTVLNDNSWETISAISAAGTGANYWSVGDAKTITLSGTVGSVSLNTSLNVFIIGFDHNSAKEGTGISFSGFKTTDATKKDVCLVDGSYNSYSSSATSFTMNPGTSSSSTNSGGWKKAKIRKNILGSTDVENGDATSAATTSPVTNTLMAALPADLRAVLKPITKYTDNVGNKSTAASSITPTVDYLPLMAEFEVFGTRSYANTNEQTYQAQYQYYKNGKSKVKYKHSDVTTAASWWLRSPNASGSASFCCVYSGGSANYYDSRYSFGLAPAFLV